MTPTLLTLVVFSTPLAHASDAPSESGVPGERPLALPGPGGSPDGPPPVAQHPRPAGPPLSSQKLAALRQYQSRRLILRTEQEFHGGGATVNSGFWYGYPYGWSGMGWVVSQPIEVTRGWGVYQGPQRLAVPEFLSLAGDLERSQTVQADIDRSKRAGRAWYAVAGVGAAAMLTGVFGVGLADDFESARTFDTLSWAGATVTVGGLLAGSFPTARASRLSRVPAATLTSEEATALVDAHNEKLAGELGLSPDEVWQVESAGPPHQ